MSEHVDASRRRTDSAGTAGFIAAAARNLPPSDVWCIFYPAVRIMLQSDVLELDEDSIMSALIPPVGFLSILDRREQLTRPS